MILNSAGLYYASKFGQKSSFCYDEGSSKGSKKRVDRTCSRIEMTIRD